MIPPTWWAIAGLTAALGAASWVAYDAIEDKGRLAVERDDARKLAQANADAVAAIKTQTEADMKLLADEAERVRKAARGVVVIRQEIARDPEANDRTCPAVERFLDRLRQPSAAGGQDREGGDPGASAPVR